MSSWVSLKSCSKRECIPFAIWTSIHISLTGLLPILLTDESQGCHQYWERSSFRDAIIISSKEDMVGRCAVLYLCYKIANSKFNMIKNKLFTVSWILWVRLTFVVIINKSQYQSLRGSLKASIHRWHVRRCSSQVY